MSCLQRRSATAQLDPPFSHCRLCSLFPRNVGSSSKCARDRMWPHPTYILFCSSGNPTYVSLPGWQPVPNALSWPSAMHATEVISKHQGWVWNTLLAVDYCYACVSLSWLCLSVYQYLSNPNARWQHSYGMRHPRMIHTDWQLAQTGICAIAMSVVPSDGRDD